MHVMDGILAMAGLPIAGAALYLLALTVLWRRPAAIAPVAGRPRFVILVPAHNEALGIGSTIRSLQAVAYPESLRRIVVVADNCTDDTAGAAAAHGADVIVRTDAGRRGKGYALQCGIEALLTEADGRAAWDALVVVDADTVVSPNLLDAFAARFEAGAAAVQAAYLPRRSGGGPIAVITDVAFVAFHLVRSAGRERLGLSCGLRGNGMAFRRDLLRDVPHTAFSRTEDLEFGVLLGLAGVRVAFAADATVYGDMPERQAVVNDQRERWIGGRAAIARRFVPSLLAGALRRPSALLADLAIDLVVPPLSVLAVVSAAGLAAGAALALAGGGATVSLAIWATACAGLAVHVAHAARLAGHGRSLVAAALALPAYALGKTAIAIRALRPSEERWVRTLREGERQ